MIGHPVAHSLSPLIHARFAAETGQDMEYGRLEAPTDAFGATARGFFDAGGRGLNVTVPFKAEAFDWCDERSERAARAGAVNTLSIADNQRTIGDNTDGAGLVRDLRENLGLVLTGRRVLLVGAGGAARGAVGPLLAEA
ncbi:MAG: shikimate dehydrogenase, partial [Halofilum sp. (in: g-proteobacteria)]